MIDAMLEIQNAGYEIFKYIEMNIEGYIEHSTSSLKETLNCDKSSFINAIV